MAVVTLEEVRKSTEGEVSDLPPSMPLPKDRYSARIKEGSFGPSKNSRKNQITFKCEVYYPDVLVHPINKKKYNIAGKEFTIYKPCEGAGLEHTLEFMSMVGLVPSLDTDNPSLKQFNGKCFSIILQSKDMTQRKELTPEEIDSGKNKWDADPILDETGKPSMSYGIEVAGFGDIRPTSKVPPSTGF